MGFAFAACSPSVKVVEPVETPTAELSAIDSLMWRQPDSALAQLQRFAISPAADSLDEFNGHYCQLLISELLYKNYKQQSNRDDLLLAVDYFDSIVAADGTDIRKADAHGMSIQEQNVFFDARAHYINGVGAYEKGDVVQACAEYLKALKLMEGCFEEKALVGKRAQFMANAYNRIGDLFSEQYMMESAITCYENALVYCKIEPTSPIGISNILYRIGKQYDKKNEIEIASLYYGQAIESMATTDNMVYRNIVASKALCDYEMKGDVKQSLYELNHVLCQAKTENERLNRHLTIGGIYFYEDNYDSALYYLEPVFENHEAGLQDQAANYLYIVYDKLGNKELSDSIVHYLTSRKKLDGENKAMVSELEDMFKAYTSEKQEKAAEARHEAAIKRLLGTIIPLAFVLAVVIIVWAKSRSKKLLNAQQEESARILGKTEQEHEKELRLWQTETKERHAEELRAHKDRSEKEIEKIKMRHVKEMETERLAYEKEQEILKQNLKERDTRVNVLEKTLNLQQEEAKQRRMAFLKEPICQYIRNKLSGKNINTRENAYELGIALKDEDFEQLREAVEKHYNGFDHVLLSQYPGLKHGHLALCHLHLLGINESEIAVLKNVSYSAIKKQNESLQEKLGIKDSMSKYVFGVAEGLCVPQDVPQDVPQGVSHDVTQEITQAILGIIAHNPKITREEMAHQLGVSSKTVGRYLKKLDGRVRYVGSGYSGHWEVMD